MATLTDLTQVLSRVTGVPEATIFAAGRFAREAGYISQGGRGRGGAEMTVSDTANLLLALCAPKAIKDAPKAIEIFRRLTGRLVFKSSGMMHLRSLNNLFGVVDFSLHKSGHSLWTPLPGNFGDLLELLISKAADTQLLTFFKSLPVSVYDVDEEALFPNGFKNLSSGLEQLMLKRNMVSIPSHDTQLGKHMWLETRFDRARTHVDIDVGLLSGDDNIVASVEFGASTRKRVASVSDGDLGMLCRIGECTILALGFALSGRELPDELSGTPDFQKFFSNYLATPDQQTSLVRAS